MLDVIVNEVVKNDINDVLCKLNIMKIDDQVDWEYLQTILDKEGFGQKRIR